MHKACIFAGGCFILFLYACRSVPRVVLDNGICFLGSTPIKRWPVCGWILPPATPEEPLFHVDCCPGIRSPLREGAGGN